MGGAEPRARLEGGWGGLAGRVETGVVTGVHTPFGDDVPPAEAPGASSVSPWGWGTAPPRSMKSERSFISRAWMSSGLPCDSVDASHLLSHSPQWACVCPGSAAVCGCEWTNVGCTEGTLAVTGWRPTAEQDEGGEEEEGRGGPGCGAAGGTS